MAGHPAHQAGVLVVHDAGPGGAVAAAFGGGEASCRTVRPKSCRGQAERAGHQPADGGVQWFARHRRHHLAQQHEPGVGVGDSGSWRPLWRDLAQVAEQFGARSAPAVEPAAARQAGGVREQVRDGDAAVAAGGGIRQVGGHRVTEPELTPAGQRERDRGGRHHLGQRGEVEDGIGAHRAPGDGVGLADRPPAERDRSLAGRGDGTGDAAVADGLVEERADPVCGIRRH